MNSVVERLCTNQSWTMNWIHAAASRFRMVAGWNCSRVISSRLTTRGFGTSRLAVSGRVCSSGTLRPNRQPAAPIRGYCRSLLRAVGRPRLANCRIEVGRDSAASRAAAPRCRAGSSPAARCGFRPAGPWRAGAAAGATRDCCSSPPISLQSIDCARPGARVGHPGRRSPTAPRRPRGRSVPAGAGRRRDTAADRRRSSPRPASPRGSDSGSRRSSPADAR